MFDDSAFVGSPFGGNWGPPNRSGLSGLGSLVSFSFLASFAPCKQPRKANCRLQGPKPDGGPDPQECQFNASAPSPDLPFPHLGS